MLDDDKIKLINDQSKATIAAELQRLKQTYAAQINDADNLLKAAFSKCYDYEQQIASLASQNPKTDADKKQNAVDIKFYTYKRDFILNNLNNINLNSL